MLSTEQPTNEGGQHKNMRKKKGQKLEDEKEKKLQLLGKRQKQDSIYDFEVQQRELDEHHENISRQISKLSDIRYQPSNNDYPKEYALMAQNDRMS